jgi:phenylacetic acid degradation operon negative regulatory protein
MSDHDHDHDHDRVLDTLPPAVQQLVSATNAGDPEGFVAAFTEDGVVDDQGRRFEGREQIAAWDAAENTGVRSRFEVRAAAVRPDGVTMTVEVRGGGYQGPGTFEIRLADGRVDGRVSTFTIR